MGKGAISRELGKLTDTGLLVINRATLTILPDDVAQPALPDVASLVRSTYSVRGLRVAGCAPRTAPLLREACVNITSC